MLRHWPGCTGIRSLCNWRRYALFFCFTMNSVTVGASPLVICRSVCRTVLTLFACFLFRPSWDIPQTINWSRHILCRSALKISTRSSPLCFRRWMQVGRHQWQLSIYHQCVISTVDRLTVFTPLWWATFKLNWDTWEHFAEVLRRHLKKGVSNFVSRSRLELSNVHS